MQRGVQPFGVSVEQPTGGDEERDSQSPSAEEMIKELEGVQDILYSDIHEAVFKPSASRLSCRETSEGASRGAAAAATQ